MSSSTKTSKPNLGTAPGELTPEILRGFGECHAMGDADRARHNAVTNNDLQSLALNREVLRGDDGHFSHRIKSKGITNQKKSGRCWMFAALNVLRPQVIRDHHMEEFEFSTAYLQFWDKLEKANLFLESVIELRDVDYLDRDWEVVSRCLLEDGGWWNYAVDLIGKYGVVPLSVMPQTHSSENTEVLNDVLGRLVRVWGVKMFRKHMEGGTDEEMRALKEEGLKEFYRVLVLNFGAPPREFEWRFRHTKKGGLRDPDADMMGVEEEDLTSMKRFTPQSFYETYVSHPLSEFVCLYNDPKNPVNRHYSFDRARNIEEAKDMSFVNVDMAEIRKTAVASILANEPLWLAVNMEPDQSKGHGLMAQGLFDYEALFDVDLSISKADRARFHAGVSGHAMALMGVDLNDAGEPRKWLVENSWGDEEGKGKEGLWTIFDDWFDEHVYTLIAHKRYVAEETLKLFEDEPIRLPAWYPGAGRDY